MMAVFAACVAPVALIPAVPIPRLLTAHLDVAACLGGKVIVQLVLRFLPFFLTVFNHFVGSEKIIFCNSCAAVFLVTD
jgi:hypothetical protein